MRWIVFIKKLSLFQFKYGEFWFWIKGTRQIIVIWLNSLHQIICFPNHRKYLEIYIKEVKNAVKDDD